jgi:hypothetical protein
MILVNGCMRKISDITDKRLRCAVLIKIASVGIVPKVLNKKTTRSGGFLGNTNY